MAPAAWVTVARILKTHGVRGELTAELLTDFPDLFAARPQLSLLSPAGARRSFTLEGSWFHGDRIVLKLTGLDAPEPARAWLGAEVQVPRTERAPAPEGSWFLSDLEGCEVFDRGVAVGTVARVELIAGAPALLHVVRPGEPEAAAALVPFVAAFLRKVDLAASRLELELPEGLLDVNRG